jgi:hypothetical protein
MRADVEERLRALVLEASDALDPEHQGDAWPDPLAWDGRPVDVQAGDLLVLVEAEAEAAPDPEKLRWKELAQRMREALGQ